jgi:PKD repeat protein
VSLEKPPAAVTLSAPTEVGEDYMVLQWSRNTDTDFARYEAFMSEAESAPLAGLTPRVVPSQSVTTYNFTGLEPRRTYWFRVRVVDNAGLTSVSNEVYGTTLRENQPPVASLMASRTRAHVGDSITFGADASYDPDRGDRLVRFQWDFEGRGRFPLDTGPISSQRHEFTKAGKYMVQVRVFDNRGASSVGTVNVTILENGNAGPDAATLALVAVIVIAVIIGLGALAIRRRPPAETYYEEKVHKPVARRRQDYWPDDEEVMPVRKVVKKRRV